jgi:hypothetical protein
MTSKVEAKSTSWLGEQCSHLAARAPQIGEVLAQLALREADLPASFG